LRKRSRSDGYASKTDKQNPPLIKGGIRTERHLALRSPGFPQTIRNQKKERDKRSFARARHQAIPLTVESKF
jgi:hypothetical protein